MTSYTYDLFKLIKADYKPEKTRGEFFSQRQKQLKSMLKQWQDGETYFENKGHGLATWQLEEFKKFLKKMSLKLGSKDFELNNITRFSFQFLPCVLLAEELGLIKIHSFLYTPSNFKKSAVVDKNYGVHMKFMIDILNLDDAVSMTPKVDSNSKVKSFTSPTTGEKLEARYDNEDVAISIRLNGELLGVGRDNLMRGAVKLLGRLILNGGRFTNNVELIEAMERDVLNCKDRVLDDAVHNLRKVGGIGCIKTIKKEGRKLI